MLVEAFLADGPFVPVVLHKDSAHASSSLSQERH